MAGPSVNIIGGGMAGLSAANPLITGRITNVLVLEASCGLGGCIYMVEFGNGLIELGANWIYGSTDANSVYKLAMGHGLVEDNMLLERMSGNCYNSNGKMMNKDLVNRIWQLFLQWESEYDKSEHKSLVPNMSNYYRKCLQMELQSRRGLVALSEVEDAKFIFNCLLNYLSFYEDISLEEAQKEKGNEGYVDLPGGDVKVLVTWFSRIEINAVL